MFIIIEDGQNNSFNYHAHVIIIYKRNLHKFSQIVEAFWASDVSVYLIEDLDGSSCKHSRNLLTNWSLSCSVDHKHRFINELPSSMINIKEITS